MIIHWKCIACGELLPGDYILGHLKGAHDLDLGLLNWPDGSVVVIDETLTPDDFGKE